MNSSNAIGGYFELSCMGNKLYHSNAILLNSGRNALRYIIQLHKITQLIAPTYTCQEVIESIRLENCEVQFYNIDHELMPTQLFKPNDYILYTNYFGVCGNNVNKMVETYPNLLIDNSQAFYSFYKGLSSFYSPRKFFGLPDGGLVLCKTKMEQSLDYDCSYKRCSHLLKRWDESPENGYYDFKLNDESLSNQPIRKMSKLTNALMGNIDYESIKQLRINNFNMLNKFLKKSNELCVELSADDTPMVYPYLINNNSIRKKLLDNRIYIARYWPDIEKLHPISDYEKYLQEYLLPLPIDQRYGEQDMMRLIEVIFE